MASIECVEQLFDLIDSTLAQLALAPQTELQPFAFPDAPWNPEFPAQPGLEPFIDPSAFPNFGPDFDPNAPIDGLNLAMPVSYPRNAGRLQASNAYEVARGLALLAELKTAMATIPILVAGMSTQVLRDDLGRLVQTYSRIIAAHQTSSVIPNPPELMITPGMMGAQFQRAGFTRQLIVGASSAAWQSVFAHIRGCNLDAENLTIDGDVSQRQVRNLIEQDRRLSATVERRRTFPDLGLNGDDLDFLLRVLVLILLALLALLTLEDTFPYDQEPKNCDEVGWEIDNCSKFSEASVGRNFEAVRRIILSTYRTISIRAEVDTYEETCMGGKHWLVYAQIGKMSNQFVGSIVCCPCCEDTKAGPIERTACWVKFN